MQISRQQLCTINQKLGQLGLNKGTSGNVSVRLDDSVGGGFLVTPSGMSIEEMTPESMVHMQLDGSFEQSKKPSSEWRFHRDILASRLEINAIIHTTACSPPRLPACTKIFPHFIT